MIDPLTLSVVAGFVGKKLLGDAVGHLTRTGFTYWKESTIALPSNNEIELASESALRSAALVLVLELAGRIDPNKSWLSRWAEKLPGGGYLTKELFPGTKDPHRQWLDALRKAINSAQFRGLHRYLKLEDERLRQCFAEGDVCRALGPGLPEAVLEWVRFTLQGLNEHPAFENLVRNGWTITEGDPEQVGGTVLVSIGLNQKGANLGGHPGRPVNLTQVYALFFLEHLKRNPKVFNTWVIDTMSGMRRKLNEITAGVPDGFQALLDKLDGLSATPRLFDLSAFEQWLEPQLGEIKSLLGNVKKELSAIARGQRELRDQQGEILVALTTLRTEVARDNSAAQPALDQLTMFIDRLGAAFQHVEEKLFGLPLIRPSVPPEPEPADGDLWIIEAKYRSLSLAGREDEMQSLWQWLHSEEPISVRLLTGDAGAGKTRLGFELIWRVAAEYGRDWQAGRVTSDDLRMLTGENYLCTWEWNRPTFVLLDYARASHDALSRLLKELARRRDQPGLPKFRLLLLERRVTGSAEWLETLCCLKSADGGPPVRKLFDPAQPVALTPLAAPALRLGIFVTTLECVARFHGADRLPVPREGAEEQFDEMLSRPEWCDPLVVIMAALVANQRRHLLAAATMSRADLALELAEYEAGRVVKYAGRRLPPGEETLIRHIAALAVMAGGLGLDEVHRLVETESGFVHAVWDNRYRNLPEVLATAWPRKEGGVGALQPDIVAEAFVIRNLANRMPVADSTAAVRRLVRNHERACAGLTLRAFHNFQNEQADAEILATWAEALVTDGLATTDAALLSALDDSMPDSTTALRESAATIAEARYLRVKSTARDDDVVQNRAELGRVASRLATRLSALGRREEALAPALEAVAIRRELAATSPSTFLPDLAESLNDLAIWLSALGRREEALAPALEAVAIRRELAATSPDAFRPDLAVSLNNLANRLSALGRHAEALAKAQEAVRLHRTLDEQDPDAFRPDLAMSVNNLANRLSALGRRDEALILGQEAVGYYRALAKQNPDAFRPDLAGSLSNLAIWSSALGQRGKGLTLAQEAVELYGSLVEQNPDAFLPAFAMSLNNLANRLNELERREEALVPARKAVEIRRALAGRSPEAFRPALAMSLNNLADLLSELGRGGEALVPGLEAVELYRELAKNNPDAFRPALSSSLETIGQTLDCEGRSSEALAAFKEGVWTLLPQFQTFPDAHALLMSRLAQGYRRLAEALNQSPDETLLAPVTEILARLEKENSPPTAPK